MFNLLIAYDCDSWESGSYKFSRDRVATQYTTDELTERYRDFTSDTQMELKSFPCIFAIENEPEPSRLGYITNIKVTESAIVVKFEFDDIFPHLPPGALRDLASDLDIASWERSRTQWAIKEVPLFKTLVERELITQEQVERSHERRHGPVETQKPSESSTTISNKIFIVHGHDDVMKLDIANFVKALGLEPIILHEQASAGMTIIEKIEQYSDVGFGIVLYTPCDTGCKTGAMKLSYRARQNVVFEHGYLIGKLGRGRVAALVKGDVETPNDISGIVYVPVDDSEQWKHAITTELKGAGYHIP